MVCGLADLKAAHSDAEETSGEYAEIFDLDRVRRSRFSVFEPDLCRRNECSVAFAGFRVDHYLDIAERIIDGAVTSAEFAKSDPASKYGTVAGRALDSVDDH